MMIYIETIVATSLDPWLKPFRDYLNTFELNLQFSLIADSEEFKENTASNDFPWHVKILFEGDKHVTYVCIHCGMHAIDKVFEIVVINVARKTKGLAL